ncbi:hypothetical protein [Niallia sp. 01092]
MNRKDENKTVSGTFEGNGTDEVIAQVKEAYNDGAIDQAVPTKTDNNKKA